MNNKDLEEYLEHREDFQREINKIMNNPEPLSNFNSISSKIIFIAIKKVAIRFANRDEIINSDIINRLIKGFAINQKEYEIYGKKNTKNNIILNYLNNDLFRKVIFSDSKIILPKNPIIIDKPIIEDSYNNTDEYDGVLIGSNVRLIKNSFNSSTIESIFYGFRNNRGIEDDKLLIKDSFNNSSLKKLFATDRIYEIRNSFNNCKNLEEFIFGINKKNHPSERTYIYDSLNGESKLKNIVICNALRHLIINNSFFKMNSSGNWETEEEYDLTFNNNNNNQKYRIQFDHGNKTIYCNNYDNITEALMAVYHLYIENKVEYLWIKPYLNGQLYNDYNIVYGQDNNNTNQNGFQNRKKS